MIEKHPFGDFVSKNTKYLILGSFVGKESTYANGKYRHPNSWYYGAKRNQFWKIIEAVYGISLTTRKEKEKLFNTLNIGVTDIILACERLFDSNLDNNLTNKLYNTESISRIFNRNKLVKVFFSSRAVETEFKRHFKQLWQKFTRVEYVTLPSPSPRYAAMPFVNKIKRYKELLPKLTPKITVRR